MCACVYITCEFVYVCTATFVFIWISVSSALFAYYFFVTIQSVWLWILLNSFPISFSLPALVLHISSPFLLSPEDILSPISWPLLLPCPLSHKCNPLVEVFMLIQIETQIEIWQQRRQQLTYFNNTSFPAKTSTSFVMSLSSFGMIGLD